MKIVNFAEQPHFTTIDADSICNLHFSSIFNFQCFPQQLKRLLLAGFTIAACVVSGSATTLLDYRHQVSGAIRTIQQLQLARDEASANAALARLRAQLPAKETILLQGQSIAADNSWFQDALDEYEKVKTNPRRTELLARIGERLLALSERLDELDKGSGVAPKDQNKGRLAEILRRPEYNKAAAEGSALERLWMRFLRWLSSLLPKSQPLQPGSSRLLSAIARVVVVLVGLALIAFLVWKFAPRFLRSQKKKKQKREARIVLGERLEQDQTSADLLAQAESLARSGDLRAAIRKAYIAFLCELADRKVISLAQHKTNRDYLSSVRERASLYASMRKLTNSFEVHWYGLVSAGEADWYDFRSSYLQALKMQ
jgi:hypothetical protein